MLVHNHSIAVSLFIACIGSVWKLPQANISIKRLAVLCLLCFVLELTRFIILVFVMGADGM